jgi:hypothetical protein
MPIPAILYDGTDLYDTSDTYNGVEATTEDSELATVLENLVTRRNNVALELAELVSKPDYSIDGQSVQWTAFKASLYKELEDLNNLINMMDPYQLTTIAT